MYLRRKTALNFYSRTRKLLPLNIGSRWFILLISITLLIGCDSDIRTVDETRSALDVNAGPAGAGPTLQLDSTETVTLVEGQSQAVIPVSITRALGQTGPITLSARGATALDDQQLSLVFEQDSLEIGRAHV